MGYGRAMISVQYSDSSDFSDPLVRFLTSTYSLPSTVSAFMPLRDSAPSTGQTVFTSALTSGFAVVVANRGTTAGLMVSCTTSDGACRVSVPSGSFAFLPHILTASNVSVSAVSGAAVPFEFLLLGI